MNHNDIIKHTCLIQFYENQFAKEQNIYEGKTITQKP